MDHRNERATLVDDLDSCVLAYMARQPREEPLLDRLVRPDASDGRLSADRLFRSLTRGTPLEGFHVVAWPGDLLEQPLRGGDLLLRVALGEPRLGHVAVLVDGLLEPPEALAAAGFQLEAPGRGRYAHVIEAGAFPHTRLARFARRVLDASCRVLPEQLILRSTLVHPPESESALDEAFESDDFPVASASEAAEAFEDESSDWATIEGEADDFFDPAGLARESEGVLDLDSEPEEFSGVGEVIAQEPEVAEPWQEVAEGGQGHGDEGDIEAGDVTDIIGDAEWEEQPGTGPAVTSLRMRASNIPKDVADALGKKDWPLALKLAIQAGWRDENELTNLIFFARHTELPPEKLDPKGPTFKQLSGEWSRILDHEVWKAIQASAENTELVVSGEEVADHHRFFWGKSGKRLKQLVEDAAREVDLNPGLLGAIMMAETRRPQSYLLSGPVSSYHIGADDFYEGRAAIKARVPAYAKVKWDKNQTPIVHDNDAQSNPRKVQTIQFSSGPDAVLATAVYVKFREVRFREIAAELKGDFDNLPLATRFALLRMAMGAGTAGATPFLKDALKGKDIFIRKAIPVRAYQTQRNATVRTAQAMHLSDWIFGIKVAPATPPAAEESENSDDSENLVLEDAGVEGEEDTLEFQVGPVEQEVDVREDRGVEAGEPLIVQHDVEDASTREVAVGQRVELDLAKTTFAAKLDKVRWTIPGRVVRGYDGTVRDAKLVELTNADLERPKISFFWVDAADGRTVRATILTKSGAVEVFVLVFDVKGPTVNAFTAKTGVTRIQPEHGQTRMRFGKLIDAPGIKWNWTITMPPKHAGHIKDVQTVLTDRSKVMSLEPGGKETRKSVWRHPSKIDLHVQLDGDSDNQAAYTEGLYEQKIGAGESFTNNGTSDSPRVDLPSLGKSVSVNDQFTYYIMFKPATDKAQDAIWVPVAKANWFWKATANQADKKWVARPSKMTPNIDMATTDFPMYETNGADNEWQQVSPEPGPSDR